jgi:hypothetical protein
VIGKLVKDRRREPARRVHPGKILGRMDADAFARGAPAMFLVHNWPRVVIRLRGS